jgi:hypothetical protein
MKEFFSLLLGNQTGVYFLALIFFALLGAGISLLLQTTARDVVSPATPKHFSWVFFWIDNWKRIVLSLLLIYVALRFAPDLFGVTINEFWALAIGFANDKIAQALKDKTGFLGQKKQ